MWGDWGNGKDRKALYTTSHTQRRASVGLSCSAQALFKNVRLWRHLPLEELFAPSCVS